LAGTLEDRAVILPMRRKRKDEAVERLRYAANFNELRRKLARWACDNADSLRAISPSVPESLHDRAADNWAPLLAIADTADADWSIRARRAALELSCDALGAEGDTLELLALPAFGPT
jgi:putative DNA primase/helicase